MKILAFAATSSRNSINKQLVSHAIGVLENEINETAETELIDLNDYEMPIYSIIERMRVVSRNWLSSFIKK